MDTTATKAVGVEEIELFAEELDVRRAAAIYQEHGCLVVRGLMREYVAEMTRDIEAAAAQSIALLDQARPVPEGWVMPNGTLFLPAPPHFARDKQIMVLAVSYYTSAAFFRSALDRRTTRRSRALSSLTAIALRTTMSSSVAPPQRIALRTRNGRRRRRRRTSTA